MLSCPLKLCASRLHVNSMPRATLSNDVILIEHIAFSTSGASLVENISARVVLGLFCSPLGPVSHRLMHKNVYPWETAHVVRSFRGQLEFNTLEDPGLKDSIQADSCQRTVNSFDEEDDKEILRRKRIGHANKGKVPWNKGRKHSEETLERIRQRTKEALKDPKVRKKMSECPRALSNQTKTKIRASLTKLWGKRTNWKRLKEKFLQSWAESIAVAAKIGGSDQQELEWDSYDKIQQEMALLNFRQASQRAEVKEMARIQAEKAAQVRAEKMARLAQRRREREENAKVKGESTKKRNRKSKEEKEKLAEFQEVKLKERLIKIHKKKSTVNQVSYQHKRLQDKFDLDFTKAEHLQKEIPLADQIRFAKGRRAEQLLDKL